jgi:hypothetical protein
LIAWTRTEKIKGSLDAQKQALPEQLAAVSGTLAAIAASYLTTLTFEPPWV